MTHWLLYFAIPKIENAAIYTLTGGLVTTLILSPFRRVLKKLWRAIDSLDPETNTGITGDLRRLESKVASLDSNSDQHVPSTSPSRQRLPVVVGRGE